FLLLSAHFHLCVFPSFPTRRSSDLSFFLFALSLFPFATSWISEYTFSLVPAITYGGVSLGANIAYYFLARELVNSDTAHKKAIRSEEHTSELQSRFDLVCRLLLEKK